MSTDGDQAIPGSGDVPDELARVLLERYREPHRRYHDDRHLASVLAAIELLVDAADDPAAVRLAAWFHDAVYEPGRTDNEETSALLAEGLLERFDVPAPRIAEVARLVRLTVDHDPSDDDHDGSVLCDADLSVLGGDADGYSDYAAGIRTEYAFIDDATFARERTVILQGLLSRPRIFRTQTANDLWESRARRNLQLELALLASQN